MCIGCHNANWDALATTPKAASNALDTERRDHLETVASILRGHPDSLWRTDGTLDWFGHPLHIQLDEERYQIDAVEYDRGSGVTDPPGYREQNTLSDARNSEIVRAWNSLEPIERLLMITQLRRPEYLT